MSKFSFHVIKFGKRNISATQYQSVNMYPADTLLDHPRRPRPNVVDRMGRLSSAEQTTADIMMNYFNTRNRSAQIIYAGKVAGQQPRWLPGSHTEYFFRLRATGAATNDTLGLFIRSIVSITMTLGNVADRDKIQVIIEAGNGQGAFLSTVYHEAQDYDREDVCREIWDKVDGYEYSEGVFNPDFPLVVDEKSMFRVKVLRVRAEQID